MINRSQLGKTTMLKRPEPKGPMGLPGGRRKMPKPKRPRPPKSMLPKKPRPKLPSRKLTPEQIKRILKSPDLSRKLSPEMMKKFKKLAPKAMTPLKRKAMKKGGFPDLSGDGKVTKKDILMGRGVIKKKLGGPVSMIAKKAGKTIGMGRGGKNLIKKKKPNRKK